MKTAGIILLAISMISSFFSLCLMAVYWDNLNDISGIPFGIGFLVFILSLLIAIPGVILFFLGRSQEKKKKNQHTLQV